MRRLLLALGLVGFRCQPTRDLPPCVEERPDGGRALVTDGDPVLLAAGDVAEPGGSEGALTTARLLDERDGVIAMLGDGVQGEGGLDEFLDLYHPAWGRHRWRTRPTPGNHEYKTAHAGPYFAYFCAAAGPPFEGWYSFDLGMWHVVVLNSACAEDPPNSPACDASSKQIGWLREDLAAHPARCTLAYWHHPRFSSGFGGDQAAMKDAWDVLYGAGAELVLGGHSHNYERFAPQTPSGTLDRERGIRQFVAGTGGADHTGFGRPDANSEVRIEGAWGLLELRLHPEQYAFRFVATDGSTLDEGSGQCH